MKIALYSRHEHPSISVEGRSASKKPIDLDLYPILHIGSQYYFDTLETYAEAYDIVLFELITSSKNTVLHRNQKHRRALAIDVRSMKAESIASQFNFTTQLDMQLRRPNWYIADLDAETVYELESQRKNIVLQKYVLSKLQGRVICSHMHMLMYTCTHILAYIHTYIHTHTHSHTHTHIHVHTYIHTYVHSYTCTHTYAHRKRRFSQEYVVPSER